MPIYHFQRHHIELIRQGIKRQTIRKRRKIPTEPGDNLYLWTDYHQGNTEKIGEYVCKSVTPVVIHDLAFEMNDQLEKSAPRLTVFANLDGFSTWQDLALFFGGFYGLPFEGEIICW